MTSLQESSSGTFDWFGGGSAPASSLDWAAPEAPKDETKKCAGLTTDGLEALNCAEKQEFGCEAKADAPPAE